MSSVVGGPLTLKGGISLTKSKKAKHKHKKKKKHHKKHKKSQDSEDELQQPGATSPKSSDSDTDTETDEDNLEGKGSALPIRMTGTGRLLSSGTTIYGSVGTKFMKELANGDVIIVKHPTTLVEEIRVVTMVLSDVSMSISSAFSSDLITGTAFEYMKKPKETASKKRKKGSKKDLEEEQQLAFGTFASKGDKFTYRVRKGGKNTSGGYTIITERLKPGQEPPSREELMNLRAKKQSDRYCM